MNNVGIWLDKEKAFIINIKNGNESLKKIDSNVDDFRIHGGSGSRVKGGPQDVVQDSKFLEKENHQLKAYFKELANEVEEADALAIFGPAETYIRFQKYILDNYPKLGKKISTVKNADSMTENQMIAMVQNFFSE